MYNPKNKYNHLFFSIASGVSSFLKNPSAVVAVIVFFVFVKSCDGIFSEPATTGNNQQESTQYPKDQNGNYIFSPADASCYPLEQYLKNNLDDADSYEHVKTMVWNPGNGHFVVESRFRAKNELGITRLWEIVVWVDEKTGELIKINTAKPVNAQ